MGDDVTRGVKSVEPRSRETVQDEDSAQDFAKGYTGLLQNYSMDEDGEKKHRLVTPWEERGTGVGVSEEPAPSGFPGAYVSFQHPVSTIYGQHQTDGNATGFNYGSYNGMYIPYIHSAMQQQQMLDFSEKKPGNGTSKYMNRRSLKMLTSQFLGEYGRQIGTIIHVDAASEKLRTVRRRMYDIMAVCVEIGLVSRAGKGRYKWLGDRHVEKALDELSSSKMIEEQSKKNASSLGGLTRGMVSFLIQCGPNKLVEVDHIAMKVLGLDDTESTKTLKPKLRRAYDVSSVLCALKMTRDDLVKDRQATKHKRCLMWKGCAEIGRAIEEAEKIDFTAYMGDDNAPSNASNLLGVFPDGSSLPKGYLPPGIFPIHPGSITGNGLDKDAVISLPDLTNDGSTDFGPFLQNNNHAGFPMAFPVGIPSEMMGQHDLAMIHYLASASAMHRNGKPQEENTAKRGEDDHV